MTLSSGNIHTMRCDWCQMDSRGYTDKDELVKDTHELGWQTVKIGTKWHELCPECFGKIEKIEVE